jgi:hypothetical protein
MGGIAASRFLLNRIQIFSRCNSKNLLLLFDGLGMGESVKNRELRELAQLLRQVAFHRAEIDRLWQKVDALQVKMALPKKRKRKTRVR